MADPIDTADIRRRLASGEIRNPTEVLFAALSEVDGLRAENAALERKLNAALVDVVNMSNEETAAALEAEEALDELRAENTALRAIRDLAADALTELDAQPDLAHPDAVWYTGGALRAALEADRG